MKTNNNDPLFDKSDIWLLAGMAICLIAFGAIIYYAYNI